VSGNGTDYVEAILLWAGQGPSPEASEWMTRHGLSVVPMTAGMLISGDRQTFERAFGVKLVGRQPPVSLPVPAELRDVVESIGIPPERRFRGC
jgi:hypothetical protein